MAQTIHGQVFSGPYSPGSASASPAGTVLLRKGLLGYDLRDFPTHVITSTQTFTVKVLSSSLSPAALYPGSEDPTAANAIVIVRGRWEAISVETTGDVSIMSDAVASAWGALGGQGGGGGGGAADGRYRNTTPSTISNVVAMTEFACSVDIPVVAVDERVAHIRFRFDEVTVDPGDAATIYIVVGPASTALVSAGAIAPGAGAVASFNVADASHYEAQFTIDVPSAALLDAAGILISSAAATPAAFTERDLAVDSTTGLRIGAVLDPGTWGAASDATLSTVSCDLLVN